MLPNAAKMLVNFFLTQEGLNRRSIYNLIYIYGGGYRGNIGQLDKDLIVRDIG
jgi:hypothetical protein